MNSLRISVKPSKRVSDNERMKYSVVLPLALLVAVVGCKGETERQVNERPGEPPVYSVGTDDSKVNAAVAEAKATLDSFIGKLQANKDAKRYFAIKTGLATGAGSKEHIWVENVTYKDGVLANEPVDVPGKKLGSPVDVKKADVSDWMIVDGEKIEGGFTTRVLEGDD